MAVPVWQRWGWVVGFQCALGGSDPHRSMMWHRSPRLELPIFLRFSRAWALPSERTCAVQTTPVPSAGNDPLGCSEVGANGVTRSVHCAGLLLRGWRSPGPFQEAGAVQGGCGASAAAQEAGGAGAESWPRALQGPGCCAEDTHDLLFHLKEIAK